MGASPVHSRTWTLGARSCLNAPLQAHGGHCLLCLATDRTLPLRARCPTRRVVKAPYDHLDPSFRDEAAASPLGPKSIFDCCRGGNAGLVVRRCRCWGGGFLL